MPLTPDEALALGPEALGLADALRDAFGPDGDGGKKLTKKELGGLAKRLLGLGWKIARDILD